MRSGEIVFDGAPAALTADVVREIYNGSGRADRRGDERERLCCRPFTPEAAVNA
jgi:ABC-type phosphate/phosphonate transport system ATPase subunit